jgi:hypothetical protein
MLKPITLYRNEDEKVAIELMRDPHTPALLGPNTPTPVVTQVKAFLFVGTTPVKTYALTPDTDAGEGTLALDSQQLNRLHVFVTRADSSLMPVGQLNYVVHADFVDADFPLGRREVFRGTLGIVADNPAATAE